MTTRPKHPKTKEIVRFAEDLGLSPNDIAERLDIKPDTVRFILRREGFSPVVSWVR